MKRMPIVLKTPARVVIAVGLIVLMCEFLIMVMIEGIQATALQEGFLRDVAWKFADPILLTLIVSPVLYLLIFRPLNQKAELERQLDELRRFQILTVGRELRMKELVEEIAALRKPLSAEPAGDLPVASGKLEKSSHAVAQSVATQPIEEGQRNALLFMLEDLESVRKKIEDAHQEWMAALDVVNDPFFLHDKQFRVLRCNRAYQQHAGIPFQEIIGQPYYEIFPKTGAPLAGCLRVMTKAGTAAEDEEEIVVGDANYRSRTFSVYSEQGVYLHSVHILEDITESKQSETLFSGQKQVLEMIAIGTPLPETLTALVRLIEAQSPNMLGSILLLDEDGVHVRHAAGPSLPAEFVAAVDGQPIGPCAGSCGTAAYRKEAVFVEDIATDPLWANYKTAALPHGLRACWSTPIFDAQRRVLGTFAMYYRQPRLPQPEHLKLINITTNIAAIAISRHRAEAVLRESEAKSRSIIESSPVALV